MAATVNQEQRAPGHHIVIVGAGIAGVSAAQAVREAAPDVRVTLVSRERHLPYYRLSLIRYIAGEIGEERLTIHAESWYAERGIELRLGQDVRELRPSEKQVVFRNGETVPFDRLILATGAHPFVPPMPGLFRDGVFALRTVNDARAILEALSPGIRCVCVGGGLSGLEVAAALVRRGAQVIVVEERDWLLPLQLNQRAGELLAAHMRQLGVGLHTGARVAEIGGDECVREVALEDGTIFEADCVVVATGVRPNCHLAQRAGLAVNEGLVVDDHLTSSHPDILAAGDVAEHRGLLYGTWSVAQRQGTNAGLNAAGVETEFASVPRASVLRVVDLSVLSIGVFAPEEGGFDIIEDERDGRYARFVFRDQHMVGAVLLGDTSVAGQIRSFIEQKRDCSDLLRLRPSALQIIEHLGALAGRAT